MSLPPSFMPGRQLTEPPVRAARRKGPGTQYMGTPFILLTWDITAVPHWIHSQQSTIHYVGDRRTHFEFGRVIQDVVVVPVDTFRIPPPGPQFPTRRPVPFRYDNLTIRLPAPVPVDPFRIDTATLPKFPVRRARPIQYHNRALYLSVGVTGIAPPVSMQVV